MSAKLNPNKIARDILYVRSLGRYSFWDDARKKTVNFSWDDFRELAASQQEFKRENDKLRERLEMTHVYQLMDGKMVRRRVSRGHYLTKGPIYDGIDCRDETIRQQDKYIAELVERLRKLQPKYDDIGYDPRDGSDGKPERQHVPRPKVRKNQSHKVRVKAEGFDRVLKGPVQLMKPPRKRRKRV